jgi:hypothetical protein
MAVGGVSETRIYSGEAWSDARGRATIVLPEHVDGASTRLAYELAPADPSVSASVTSELHDHRFTIETDKPHSKVGWRVTARPLASTDDRKE